MTFYPVRQRIQNPRVVGFDCATVSISAIWFVLGGAIEHRRLERAGHAYLNEMGITSPSFPHENNPQGQPMPPECDTVADPEDDGSGVNAFENFMRFLAPALRRPITDQVRQGE